MIYFPNNSLFFHTTTKFYQSATVIFWSQTFAWLIWILHFEYDISTDSIPSQLGKYTAIGKNSLNRVSKINSRPILDTFLWNICVMSFCNNTGFTDSEDGISKRCFIMWETFFIFAHIHCWRFCSKPNLILGIMQTVLVQLKSGELKSDWKHFAR